VVGGKQIAKAPKGTAALGLIWRDENWSISLVDKYTGVQWAAEGEPDAYKIPGYHSADMTVAYKVGRYRLEAAVYNMFDSQKADGRHPGQDRPLRPVLLPAERNFQLSAKVNF